MKWLEKVNCVVWGIPALLCILAVGIYLTIRTGFAQFRLFPKAVRAFLRQLSKKRISDGVSPYRALCTALAATVGTGNLAGVAGAIAIGGPGAIFWMWVCGILGMMTKFSEATLAIRYREKNVSGEWIGGPMYMIKNGMGHKWEWLAGIYCFLAVVASLGVGNATQINAVLGGLNSVIASFGGCETFALNLLVGVLLAVMIASIFLGGASRIGAIAEKLVPFAALAYLLMGALVLICRYREVPGALAAIFQGAFRPRAVTGGMLGSAFVALRVGASRGVFTNEAGIGTASIAHAAANVSHPVEQGFMGIMEVFLDTIVICTMTALVILCSGIPIPYGTDTGIVLTNQAFSSVMGRWVTIPIALSLCCFAVATILGWGLYGSRCAQYLFGERVWKPFVLIQSAAVVLGAVLRTSTVWTVSEIVNGLMAIPNLIVLAALGKEVAGLIKEYESRA